MFFRGVVAGLVALSLGAGNSRAQVVQEERAGIRLSGANVQLGYVNPEGTSSAFQLGGELGLGSVVKPWLRLSVGATHWSSELDPQLGRPGLTGDLRDFQINSKLRWDLVEAESLVPFAFTGVSLHLLRADIPGDPVLQDAMSDFQPGFDVGFGLGYTWKQLRFSSEYRKQFVADVDNWSWTAGVAWWAKRRLTTQVVGYTTPQAVQPARAAAMPASNPMVSTSASTSEVSELKQLLRDVVEENRLMQAELESLRQQTRLASTAKQRGEKRVDELQVALQQLGDLSGQVDALRRSQDGLLFMLPGSILFATGSARLEVGALEELRRLMAVLLRFPDFDAVIEGHTDSIGEATRNRKLSLARAEAVRTELVRLGVTPSRLRAVGLGPDRPIADNSQAEGRARNRRVEIRFVQRMEGSLG